MTHSQRILVVGAEDGPANDIASTLEKRGVQSRFADTPDGLKASLQDAQPDILIVDGRSKPDAVMNALQATKGNGGSPAVPVIYISGKTELDADALANVDDVLPDNFREIELLSRLDSLARLNTMQDELLRRNETDQLFGLDAGEAAEPAANDGAVNAVLVTADDNMDSAVRSVLGDTAELEVCSQGFEALSALNERWYDCIIVHGNDERLDAFRLCEEIRANPRLFHMPLIVIADGKDETIDSYYAHGASDVVDANWQDGEFRNRILTHARHQRTRSQMLQIYSKAMHLATSDSLTGLYSHGYLHAHLANQIKDSEKKGHALSVGFFRIAELKDINETFGYAAGDKVLRQIGSILSCIVRGEDLPARYSGNEFCIVFPDTRDTVAEHIVHRIKSVIESTELAIPEMDRSVTVLVQAASASLSHGRDTARALINRARQSVDS